MFCYFQPLHIQYWNINCAYFDNCFVLHCSDTHSLCYYKWNSSVAWVCPLTLARPLPSLLVFIHLLTSKCAGKCFFYLFLLCFESVWSCELPSYTRGSTGRGSVGCFINWWPLVCNWNIITPLIDGLWLPVKILHLCLRVLFSFDWIYLKLLCWIDIWDFGLWTFIYLSRILYLALSPCICVTCYWQISISQSVTASDATKHPQLPLYSLCLFLPSSINTYITCRSWLPSTSLPLILLIRFALPAWVCQVEELKRNIYQSGQKLFHSPCFYALEVSSW